MPVSHKALFVVFICSRVPYSLLLHYKMFSFYFSFFLEFYHYISASLNINIILFHVVLFCKGVWLIVKQHVIVCFFLLLFVFCFCVLSLSTGILFPFCLPYSNFCGVQT